MRGYVTDDIFDLSKNVAYETARLQTATCNRLIEMLGSVPGVILGDDVGMGKTYIAFSLAAYYLKKYPKKSIVIITPNWILNNKWYGDICNFIERNLNCKTLKLRKEDIAVICQNGHGSYLKQLKQSRKRKVLLIPVNVFSSKCDKREKVFYLCCWFKHRRFRERTRISILKRLGLSTSIIRPENCTYVPLSYEDVPVKWYEEFDEIYEEDGIACPEEFHFLLETIRQKAMRRCMPKSSLLILDEAHKMKNEGTVKRRSMTNVINKKFDKAVFLTATPFQLGDAELESIMNIFMYSAMSKEERESFEFLVEDFFEWLDKYKSMMNDFEFYIRLMSQDEEMELEKMIETSQEDATSSDVKDTYRLFQKLLDCKEELEERMHKIIIRNVKKKDIYRKEIVGDIENVTNNGIPISEEAFIPYALIEKVIHQIMANGDRTFVANVKQTFTSSFGAVLESNIMERELEAVTMLSQLNLDKIEHPKEASVCKKAIEKQKNGEKVLIFCNRINTMQKLRDKLNRELTKSFNRDIKKLFPDSQKGFRNYCKRFYSKQDVSWFLLQENYVYSVLLPALKMLGKTRSELPPASKIRGKVNSIYRKYNTQKKTNYMFVKRIVEQVVFQEVLNKFPDWEILLAESEALVHTIKSILDRNYVELGLNLILDDDEKTKYEKTDRETKNIYETIKNVLEYQGIWIEYADLLNQLEPVERDELVSEMIAFLRKDKRFFLELRKLQERHEDKKNDYSYLVQRTFRKGGSLDWYSAFRRFLNEYCDKNTTETNRKQMKLGLKNSANAVAIINANTTNEARVRYQAGFNTPFYPQILIVTSTMQEGVDLQKECKEIIHYDMEWNPASLEQRVGRVDRIGSLISKLREEGSMDMLNIYYPFIRKTIDETIYRTVKDREKWFNILLGGTPQWNTFELDPDVTSISTEILKRLQINLSLE